MDAQEEELKNGMFTCLISLIQLKSDDLGPQAAKEHAIEILESYIAALKTTQ